MAGEDDGSVTGEIRLVRMEDLLGQVLSKLDTLVSLERYNLERDQLVRDLARLEQEFKEHVRKAEAKDAERDREKQTTSRLIFASFLLPVIVIIVARFIEAKP